MNKTAIAIIFGLAGLVIGSLGSTYAWTRFLETGDRNRALSYAELQLQTLQNLRGRDTPTAIRIQEKMLNASVAALARLVAQDPEDKEATVLLERITKYRDTHANQPAATE